MGLAARARRNARAIQVQEHVVTLPHLPQDFDGFTLLHITDLHLDSAPDMTNALIRTVRDLRYDACVLTGDYRARTYGAFDAALAGLAELRPHLNGTVYAHPRQPRLAAHGPGDGGDGLHAADQ